MWENEPNNIEDYEGFVYIIETEHNKKYLGQKKFWFKRTLPPLKGKKHKRRILKESDWRSYTGSSNELNEDIKNGVKYTKTILHLCKTKWEMNYLELKEQIDRNVLFKEDYYNGIIQVRIGKPSKQILEQYDSSNKHR